MAEESSAKETEVEEVPAGSQEILPDQLTIQDLVVLRNCVEVCTKRGAFQADELETVGSVYKKLHSFLSSVIVPQQPMPAPVAQPDIPPVPETATEPAPEPKSKEAKAEAKKFDEINKAALAEESNGESK
jgi:hypothetical protein